MTVEELKIAALELSEEDFQEFLRSVLEGIPVVRMNMLVKHLEEVWDVSAAAAPVAFAAPAAGGGDEGESGAEEQTEFDVLIKEIGDSKLQVIKVIREAVGVGIKEAKEMLDDLPKTIKEKVSKAEAEEIVKKLSDAGAVAESK